MRKLMVVTLLCLAAGTTGAAQGSSIYISPTIVVMGYGNATSAITVRNDSGRPVGFTIRGQRWTNLADGTPRLEDTQDVIVFPAAIALRAGESKRIRLATQVAVSAAERSYRVVLDEVASLSSAQRGLATRLQFSIPVFVQPKERTAKVWMPAPDIDKGSVHLQLWNVGRLHVTSRTVQARGFDAAGAIVWTRDFRPWYLLVEERRTHSATLSAAECRATALIVAEASFSESKALALREERRVSGADCNVR